MTKAYGLPGYIYSLFYLSRPPDFEMEAAMLCQLQYSSNPGGRTICPGTTLVRLAYFVVGFSGIFPILLGGQMIPDAFPVIKLNDIYSLISFVLPSQPCFPHRSKVVTIQTLSPIITLHPNMSNRNLDHRG